MDPGKIEQSKSHSKSKSQSQVQIAQLMMPEHANPAGNVHGGTIMKIIDNAALIAAMRHTHQNCVTASVDQIDFISPVYVGNLVLANASINFVAKHSMEIGVRIEAECLRTGVHTHVASAYLTFVALDDHDKPMEIPPIHPITEKDHSRYLAAQKRREIRIASRSHHRHSNKPCIVRPK
ncbi:MAG: acyl-CoA thioesterase [Promethearchaeota archaeon]